VPKRRRVSQEPLDALAFELDLSLSLEACLLLGALSSFLGDLGNSAEAATFPVAIL
jgi:hypothetical protein